MILVDGTQELHMMYSGGNPSPFVTEVRDQLDE
jgi:hypothetical protein